MNQYVCMYHQAGWTGRYINVQRDGGLSMVLLNPERPDVMELFGKEREVNFFPALCF